MTAFVHLNLVPMDREAVLPDQTVVVRGGRIAAAGPAAATPCRMGRSSPRGPDSTGCPA